MNIILLPKLFVIILDADLTLQLEKTAEMKHQLHILTSWLASEFEKSLETYKDMLPQKAKKPNLPFLLWMAPPTHCHFTQKENEVWILQQQCLKEIISTKPCMQVLHMVKFWDAEDRSSFIHDAQ